MTLRVPHVRGGLLTLIRQLTSQAERGVVLFE